MPFGNDDSEQGRAWRCLANRMQQTVNNTPDPSLQPALGSRVARAAIWLLLVMTTVLAGPARIAIARDVRLGVYHNPPKIFMQGENKPGGIFIDLMQRIAAQEGWQLQFVPCQWQQCLAALERGELDLLPDVAYSSERGELLDFHATPALFSWSLIYRRRDVTINSLFDLNGKRVALLRGSVQQAYFNELLRHSSIQVTFVPADDLAQAFRMAGSGEADAAIANKYFGDFAAHDNGLRDTPIVFQPVRLFYATGKGRNGDLLDAIDRRLVEWQADPHSFYFDTLRNWQQGGETRIPPGLWWAMGGAMLLLLCAFGAAAYLRREVAARTLALRRSEQSLRIAAAVFQSQEAMFVIGPDRKVIEVNQAYTDMTGYVPDTLPERTIPPFTLEDSVLDQRASMWETVQGSGRWQSEIWTRKQGGEHFAAWLTVTAVPAPDGTISHYVGTQTDITERKLVQDQAMRLAFYDPLTGLPNRRLLLDRIQHALAMNARHGRVGALLFIDLDNFKDLNDTLGHEVGDQFLQQIAQRLSHGSREADTIARLGGDEFVILMEDMGASEEAATQQSHVAARKVLAGVTQSYALSGGSHHTTCSIGIALFSGAGLSAQDLLRRGDLAMYQAKKAGRNTLCFFQPEMERALTLRTSLELDLREAVASQQLMLHYQPQVDGENRMIGAEALLRWHHPQRGAVPPGLFIPVAESSGLILQIGAWVLREACLQLAEWSGDPVLSQLQISVNVSARQFRDATFAQQVTDLLGQTGIQPSRLKIELTETMMIEDIEDTIAKMRLLRDLGVCFALDDFGTGYSSLSYLKRLPLDQLKIDQSFVADILTDPNDAVIARSVVALGTALGLGVIAEGVETAEQRDFLAAIGCHRYQGYLFARPGPASMVSGLAHADHATVVIKNG
jgi:diguanylate cyclase (GGDEF)-like protein/PAS domain S-box-containing protein